VPEAFRAVPRRLKSRRVLLGSLGLALSASAAAGERPWIEIKSPHFSVVSDAGDKRTREVAWEFEQIRAVLERLWPWARLSSGKPILVLAVRDETELKALAPRFWEQKGGLRPASVFATGRDRHYIALRLDATTLDQEKVNPYRDAYWEYAILVLDSSFDRPLPEWFRRGLAEVISNTIVRDKEILLGCLIPWHLRRLRDHGRMTLDTFLSVDRRSPYLSQLEQSRDFHAQAWVFLHYLMFGEKGVNQARLNQFARLLKEGKSEDAARSEAFGGIDAFDKGFYQNISRYLSGTLFGYQRIDLSVKVSAEGFTPRAVTPAESAGARAGLHAAMNQRLEARGLARQAQEADPALAAPYEVEGILCDGEQKTDEARAAYAKAVEARGASYYAYYRNAQLLSRPNADPETLSRIEKNLARAIELNPEYAWAYSYQADVRVRLGQKDQALGPGLHAVALEPGQSYHHMALARVLWALSRRDEAMREAETSLALARADHDRQNAEQFLAFAKKGSN
jgi:hypothetical protein